MIRIIKCSSRDAYAETASTENLFDTLLGKANMASLPVVDVEELYLAFYFLRSL